MKNYLITFDLGKIGFKDKKFKYSSTLKSNFFKSFLINQTNNIHSFNKYINSKDKIEKNKKEPDYLKNIPNIYPSYFAIKRNDEILNNFSQLTKEIKSDNIKNLFPILSINKNLNTNLTTDKFQLVKVEQLGQNKIFIKLTSKEDLSEIKDLQKDLLTDIVNKGDSKLKEVLEIIEETKGDVVIETDKFQLVKVEQLGQFFKKINEVIKKEDKETIFKNISDMENLGSIIKYNIIKLENTNLEKEIGNEFIPKVKEIIDKISKVKINNKFSTAEITLNLEKEEKLSIKIIYLKNQDKFNIIFNSQNEKIINLIKENISDLLDTFTKNNLDVDIFWNSEDNKNFNYYLPNDYTFQNNFENNEDEILGLFFNFKNENSLAIINSESIDIFI